MLGCNGYDVVDLGVMVPCERSSTPPRTWRTGDRPVRPDHAVARRMATSRRRNAAPGFDVPLLIGGRDHQPRPHRDQDRAELRVAGGLRADAARRRRGHRCCRKARPTLCRRGRRRLREGARPACQQEGRDAWSAWTRRAPTLADLCGAAGQPPKTGVTGIHATSTSEPRNTSMGSVLPDLDLASAYPKIPR